MSQNTAAFQLVVAQVGQDLARQSLATALAALEELARTAVNPIERRRAATTILRYLFPPSPRTPSPAPRAKLTETPPNEAPPAAQSTAEDLLARLTAQRDRLRTAMKNAGVTAAEIFGRSGAPAPQAPPHALMPCASMPTQAPTHSASHSAHCAIPATTAPSPSPPASSPAAAAWSMAAHPPAAPP